MQGPGALGDEAADGPGLEALVGRREAVGLGTAVVDHDSDAGNGHLGIGPSGSQGLVRSLTQELIDRLTTGEPSPQTEVREWLHRHRGDVADEVVASRELRAYLDPRQRAGRPPSLADVQRIAEQLFPLSVAPTGLDPPHAAGSRVVSAPGASPGRRSAMARERVRFDFSTADQLGRRLDALWHAVDADLALAPTPPPRLADWAGARRDEHDRHRGGQEAIVGGGVLATQLGRLRAAWDEAARAQRRANRAVADAALPADGE